MRLKFQRKALKAMDSRREETDFYPQIAKLVVPIVLQNLLSAAVNSADVVMLNFVGQSAISAVSLATQYANILFMVFYGLGTGATMLCAQYYGKGDQRAINVVEGITLRISISVSALFALAALTIPHWMMRLFTPDPKLISLGSSYLRILSIAYLCWGLTEVYLAVLRSVGRVSVSTALNAFAFVANILLNAVFIFGLFGSPKLGVAGVALGTSLSRLMELGLCFVVSAKSKDVKLKFSFLFLRNKMLFQDFIRMALPALLNDVVWGLASSMYSAIFGNYLGSDAVAANSFTAVIRNFSTILCFGVANAGGILLGQEFGKNQLEKAESHAKKLVWLTVATGLIGGVIVLCAMPIALNFADLTETGLNYLKTMLFINSYYVMGAAVNTTLIAGVFRAGGDSKFGLICDFIDMWIYALPLGFFAAAVLKLPAMWVYFLLCTDEFVKWPFVIHRYRSRKWIKNITRDDLFSDSPQKI